MKNISIYLIVFIVFFSASLFAKQNKLAKINKLSYYNIQSLKSIINRYKREEKVTYKRKKKFILPVNGKIFYKRIYKGIFIKPNSLRGSIRAAKKGKVVFSGFLKYFGNVVIIKHVHGYTTIYAYLQKVKVKRGDIVRQGEVIGISYKKHAIYFEIRKRASCLTSRKICSLILNNG